MCTGLRAWESGALRVSPRGNLVVLLVANPYFYTPSEFNLRFAFCQKASFEKFFE